MIVSLNKHVQVAVLMAGLFKNIRVLVTSCTTETRLSRQREHLSPNAPSCHEPPSKHEALHSQESDLTILLRRLFDPAMTWVQVASGPGGEASAQNLISEYILLVEALATFMTDAGEQLRTLWPSNSWVGLQEMAQTCDFSFAKCLV